MPHQFDPKVIATSLRTAFTGVEPPAELLKQLGGWDAVRVVAPTLVDDPLLLPLAMLVARDARCAEGAGEDVETFRPAANAVAGAVLATEDPGIFASGVDFFCSDALLCRVAGRPIADGCLALAAPPTSEGDGLTEASVLRRAVALEGAARLAASGHGSKNKLLGLLEDIREPQPLRYAQAVARTAAMAFDHWSLDDEIANVINILTGVTAPDYEHTPRDEVVRRNNEFRKDVEPDAEWTLANIAVGKALRLTKLADMCEELDSALEHLTNLMALDHRDDAELLRAAVALLRKLLSSLPTDDGPHDADKWDIELDEAQSIASSVNELAFHHRGLNHWSGDRKVSVLKGWSRLADDLAFLRDQLTRDSIYAASVVLDDITSIYSAARVYELTRGTHDAQHVVELIRPAIASGFAARAGLLRHLSDHTASLKERLDDARSTDQADNLRAQLKAAEQVLQAARASLSAQPERPGKSHEQAAELPPLLTDLLGSTPTVIAALEGVPQQELERLAANIADRQVATHLDPDLIVTTTRKRILAALASVEDFRDDVAPAVTAVLDQLIKFVRQRLNSQESSKPYLFNPDANERDLHVDLYEWLCQGQFGSLTNVEVQEVGAGRVDIQIQFAGFHLYLELKADATAVPVADKAAYIKQTASYQATDVRIGFLVVLRLTPPKDKSPSQHLTEYVSHTKFLTKDSAVERHIVMLEIPGNQTKPSSMR